MKRRTAILAAATFILEFGVAQACYADVLPSGPNPTEGAALLGVGVLFVVAVSGFSFWGLRRVARDRATAAVAPPEEKPPTRTVQTRAESPESIDED